MFKISYQVRTFMEMSRMGCNEWKECLRIAKGIAVAVRNELKLYRESGDNTHKKKADELKRTLPGICFQASGFEVSIGTKKYNKGKKGRWREQIHACLSGLAVIDVDHCGNPHDLYKRINNQFDLKAQGVLLVYISASGEGLKIVFKARPEWGNLICNQYEMASLLGILDYVDDSCKDSSRLSFLTSEEDILYIDNEDLFAPEENLFPELAENDRTDYDRQFGDRYRQEPKGDSSPTVQKWIDFEAQKKKQKHTASATNVEVQVESTELHTEFSEREKAIIRALNEYYGDTVAEGHRHEKFIGETAPWLQMLTDNNAKKALAMARELNYVKNWKDQTAGELESCIETVQKKPLLRRRPKALADLLEKANIDTNLPTINLNEADPMADLPFDKWCDEIEKLFDDFPCLRDVCEPHPRRLWPFLLFASAAMMGTCMSLTYYRFYADHSIRCRLNYIVLGVGDPTSGKGTLTRLQEFLLAPIIESDKVADAATNIWKEMKGNAATTHDTQARDKIYNRMFGPRASNTEFIRSMINCKKLVDGEEMNYHLITVDSEKDNSINMSKSGGWQNRDIMVLKAFHNEFDSQHYSNNQSVSGRFRVYWNQIETCTPPTLKRLVNERNFNSGLDTRMACIPMGKPDFGMIPLEGETDKFMAANETLRNWSYKLDQRCGELPVWPLVEHVHKWCDERRAIAEFNDQDQAEWLLIKRVPYYGLNVSIPYIDMRHWEEREQTGTYLIDDIDRALCNLVLDIQYRTQMHWFYDLHHKYYTDQLNDAAQLKRRTNRFIECFRLLPEKFTTQVFAQVFGYANARAGQKTLQRLEEEKAIKRTMRGHYKKLVSEL